MVKKPRNGNMVISIILYYAVTLRHEFVCIIKNQTM